MQRDDLNFDGFETFLQDQVKSHRLYPSENIWQNIDKELHGERQWPLLTFIGFVAFLSIVFLSISYQPNETLFAYKPVKAKIDNSTTAFQYQKKSNKTVIKNQSSELNKEDDVDVNITADYIELNNSLVQNTFEIEDSKPESINSFILNSPSIPKNSVEAENYELKYSIKDNISTKVDEEKKLLKSVDQFLTEHNDIVALVSQQSKTKTSKLNFHFYGTPSISYRFLKDEKDSEHDNQTTSASNLLANYTPTDLNKIIRHTPSMGFEFGAGISYNVSPQFRIRTGLQFNFREYNLGAYRSTTEVATIALISPSRVDSINSLAFYRTRNGYSPIELKNKYFEISIPLAFEYDLTKNKNLNFGVAVAIQPTYLISRNSFLLSTDYKNYTNNPNLVRGWNINSSIEGFVSYKVGDFKWTFGPQIRYQNLPTYTKKYSIREHLIDYGLKIGFSKALH